MSVAIPKIPFIKMRHQIPAIRCSDCDEVNDGLQLRLTEASSLSIRAQPVAFNYEAISQNPQTLMT